MQIADDNPVAAGTAETTRLPLSRGSRTNRVEQKKTDAEITSQSQPAPDLKSGAEEKPAVADTKPAEEKKEEKKKGGGMFEKIKRAIGVSNANVKRDEKKP